jgi:hypothetical protein
VGFLEKRHMAKKNTDYSEIYFTQKEVATRWKVTQTTLKNWRDKGVLPFFRVPTSSRILYPIEAILNIEENNIHEKEVKLEVAETKREKPVMSTIPKRKWRI